MDQTGNNGHQGHRLEAVAESTLTKLVARVVTPLMLTALVVIASFVTGRLVKQLDDQGKDIVTIKVGMSKISTRLDAQVIRQVEQNSKTNDKQDNDIRELRDRVTRVEGVIRTP